MFISTLHDHAIIIFIFTLCIKIKGVVMDLDHLVPLCFNQSQLYEPCREKTGLQGFRPGLTQTELCKHRRWLEAGNSRFRK